MPTIRLALERFEEAEGGRIAYRMKRPMPDGTTHLLFTGMELLRRLPAHFGQEKTSTLKVRLRRPAQSSLGAR